MTYIKRLIDLLEKKNIPHKKFIADLNLSKNSIVQWKTNGNTPGGDVVSKIADYLNVSTDYLLCKTDNPSMPDKNISPDAFIRDYMNLKKGQSGILFYGEDGITVVKDSPEIIKFIQKGLNLHEKDGNGTSDSTDK